MGAVWYAATICGRVATVNPPFPQGNGVQNTPRSSRPHPLTPEATQSHRKPPIHDQHPAGTPSPAFMQRPPERSPDRPPERPPRERLLRFAARRPIGCLSSGERTLTALCALCTAHTVISHSLGRARGWRLARLGQHAVRVRRVGEKRLEERRPVEGDASFDRVKELVEKFTPRGSMALLEKERCGPGRNYFVLDPIDGTKAFAAKPTIRSRAYAFTEQYCIGLSYHDGETGEVLAACVAAPRWERGSGVLLCAVKGKGCFSKELFTPASRWKRCCLMSHLCNIRLAVSEADAGKATTLNSGWKVPKSNLDEIPYGSGSLIKYVAIAVNAVVFACQFSGSYRRRGFLPV